MANEIYLPGTILNEINEAARKLKTDGTIDVPTNTASFLATVVINVGTNELVGIHPLYINGNLLDARIGASDRWWMHRGTHIDVYSDPENGVKAMIPQITTEDPLLAKRLKLIVQGVYDPSTEPEPEPTPDENAPLAGDADADTGESVE